MFLASNVMGLGGLPSLHSPGEVDHRGPDSEGPPGFSFGPDHPSGRGGFMRRVRGSTEHLGGTKEDVLDRGSPRDKSINHTTWGPQHVPSNPVDHWNLEIHHPLDYGRPKTARQVPNQTPGP